MRLLAVLLAVAASPALAQQPPPIDLQSGSLTVEHGKRTAVFSGGVVARRGDLVLECPEVTANYGKSSQIERVTCVGPVTATQGARTLTAETGSFDNATGMLLLSGAPSMVDAGRRLSGETLSYDVASGELRLTKARAELAGTSAPGALPMQITAETAIHDLTNRRSTFAGGVVATRGDMTLKSPRLLAAHDADGDVIRVWTAGGPINVVQKQRRATAEKAVFTAAGQRLVLTGEPTVTEGQSTLTGRTVTFLLDQDRVEVEKPRAVFPLGKAAMP